MATAQKHRERSKYSYQGKPDFSRFHRVATTKSVVKARGSFADAILGMFKRQKKGDK